MLSCIETSDLQLGMPYAPLFQTANRDGYMLFSLLEYELRSAERYRRFVSLVMVSANQDLPRVKELLSDYIRKSDVISDFDHSLVVMMGETDKNDALNAVNRYNRLFMNQLDLRFSVATFPDDGIRPDALVKRAYTRLKSARSAEKGAIVAND